MSEKSSSVLPAVEDEINTMQHKVIVPVDSEKLESHDDIIAENNNVDMKTKYDTLEDNVNNEPEEIECKYEELVHSEKGYGFISPNSLIDNLDLEVPSSYEVEPVDFPKSPWLSLKEGSLGNALSDEEEDKSLFQAQLLSNCQDVRLFKDETASTTGKKKKIIPVGKDIFTDSCCDESSFGGSHTSLNDSELDAYLDSPDELEDSIMERLGEKKPEPIRELTAAEERLEAQTWKSCVIAGIERRIDLKVIEPYKKVLSHGGYLSQGSHNAIIILNACYLPDRSRPDYDYVMNNLFMYVITTLDQLLTDDYIIVYFHGAISRSCKPKLKWLRQYYEMIHRKLRKNLKGLYLVHPTFWLKTLVLMTKPFVSSKFSRKLFFVHSLSELFKVLPLEPSCIPDRVKKYDELKESLEKIH